jgi:FkbM family methyltransferase
MYTRARWARRVATRRLFLGTARHVSPYVSVAHADGVFLVATHDAGVGRTTFLSGANPEFRNLERTVSVLREHGLHRRGTTFVDVGANIGTTTVPALLRHGYGRALCFEPDPDNAAVLAATLALNDLLGRAEVVRAAVSDVAGRASFGRGPLTRLGRRGGVGSLARADGASIDVDVVTLDDALAARGSEPVDVGLVWVDTQGHEGHVLDGASRLVAAGVPLVLAIRPAKLRKTGGADRLLARIEGYETAVDLRDEASAPIAPDELRTRARKGAPTDVLLF